MAKFSKTFLNKLLDLVLAGSFGDPETVEKTGLRENTTQLFKGSSLIDAGDMVYFSYTGEERLLFVTKARGGGGIYNTPQNNKVISGFLVNDVPVEVIHTVLTGLYKNAQRYGFPVRSLFTYKATKGLSRVFRSENFRTFMTTKVDGNINQLNMEINPNAEITEQ